MFHTVVLFLNNFIPCECFIKESEWRRASHIQQFKHCRDWAGGIRQGTLGRGGMHCCNGLDVGVRVWEQVGIYVMCTVQN